MKPPANPLSDSDKEAFDLYLLAWQERLGLQDWRVNRSKRKTASKANMAETKVYHRNRLANIFLGTDMGGAPVDAHTLESLALHELLHVFLAELVNQIEYGIEGPALDSAEHRVVHVLEKLLMTKPL